MSMKQKEQTNAVVGHGLTVRSVIFLQRWLDSPYSLCPLIFVVLGFMAGQSEEYLIEARLAE